jgi:hypothetical protein
MWRRGLLVIAPVLVCISSLEAQIATPAFPTWDPELLWQPHERMLTFDARQGTRSHAGTGLLIGGLVGAAATTIFLIGFCSDSDTKCEADEVGRAVLFIAVPAAVIGALIGSLVHTNDEET